MAGRLTTMAAFAEFAPRLVETITRRYGLAVRGLELACPGVNITVRMTAGEGVFYLRLYRVEGRGSDEVAGELRALAAFEATAGVYVAKPVRLRTDALFFRCRYGDQRRFAALFEEAPGEQPQPTAANLCRFAGALATLQRALGPGPCARWALSPMGILVEAWNVLTECGAAFDVVKGQISEAAELLDSLAGVRLTEGFCHGDAWLSNVRFDGDQTTFIDFDDCCGGPLADDLARLFGTVWDGQLTDFVDLARGILRAYGEASGIDPREFLAIPPLARLREVSTMTFLARYCTMDDAAWASARVLCAQRLQDWAPDGAATRAFLTAAADAVSSGDDRV